MVAERARVMSFPPVVLGPGWSVGRISEEIPVAGPVWPLSFDEEGDRRRGCPRAGTRCEKRLVRVEDEGWWWLLLLLSLLLLLLLLSLLSNAGVVVVLVVVVE
jgi:hypothetical protein